MNEVYELLKQRGFVKQVTFEEELIQTLNEKQVTFYVGFDPTADSLHVGHFIPIMAMAHLQRAGHRPIALVGGGTAMVGDPSGRTDMRQMLTPQMIEHNVNNFKKQLSRFMDFSDGGAILVNNADWLLELNYVNFLREVGTYFSVNRMLTAECFKRRLEVGLSFLEFNYMLMQAYDFYMLHQQYGCQLQLGGDDQWSNILAGADLVRRKAQDKAFGLTVSLLTNSQGEKMGKTVGGALWLDANRVSPYEFYQYWRNMEDGSVAKCLAMLTFLPMDEVNRLSALRDSEINIAKEALAFEITKTVHGEEAALQAQTAARALFGGAGDEGAVPTTQLPGEGTMRIIDLLQKTGLAKSLGEGRRLIAGGGVYLDGETVANPEMVVDLSQYPNGFMLRKGKKVYHKVELI